MLIVLNSSRCNDGEIRRAFGALLIADGCIGYFEPSIFGTGTAKASMTGLIPAWVGAALTLCGLISFMQPSLNKHLMHFAAMIGLLGAVGGFMPLFRQKFDFTTAACVSGTLMIGLSFLFVILCVRSFIEARKARQASGLPSS